MSSTSGDFSRESAMAIGNATAATGSTYDPYIHEPR
jgi:hypothetical protein